MLIDAHSQRKQAESIATNEKSDGTTTATLDLQAEQHAVKQLLEETIDQLFTPFDHLARAQIQRAYPFRCATTVLATCIRKSNATGELDNDLLRQQRIFLGAALQMLQIALAIHQFLLERSDYQQGTETRREDNSFQTQGRNDHKESDWDGGRGSNKNDNGTSDGNDEENQRSISGSIILTGDFCFTQSAILAAKTDNIAVVEIFSQTLKAVSEGILRQIFVQRDGAITQKQQERELNNGQMLPPDHYDIELALCRAGIDGAAALIELSQEQIEAAKALVEIWLTDSQSDSLDHQSSSLLALLPVAQRERWQEILQ